MTACQHDTRAIPSCDESRVGAGRLSDLEARLFEPALYEVVQLSARIRHAGWYNDHRKELEHLERGHSEAEREHVLIPPRDSISLQILNVLEVTKVALTIRSDESRVVLADALQTLVIRSSNMRPPVGTAQSLAFGGRHINSTINHGDEMSVGECIQDASWPRPVNAVGAMGSTVYFLY